MIPNEVQYNARKVLARRHFWEYAKLMSSQFYNEEKEYVKDFCNQLQEFYESPTERIMVVNMPPRHAKSYTATNFCQWVLGKQPRTRVMTASYNEKVSSRFAKQVRNKILEIKASKRIVYNDIFPKTKIKHGEASAQMWSLEGMEETSYLATSRTGTATSFGADILIIDDMIKSAEEAYNEVLLEEHWEWFNNTMLSRLEGDYKIIIIMTRWSTKDLAGKILEAYHVDRHINYKAQQDDGTMLCDSVLTKEAFEFKTQNMNKDIILANYQQEPIDIKGRLYTGFKTYTEHPKFRGIYNYTDTADTGDDYLCSITYGLYEKQAYVLDIIYTKDKMELTEPMVAKALYDCKVNIARVESNNGGRGFARNVDRLTKQMGNRTSNVEWFHQSHNKVARIMSASTGVVNNIIMPSNWADRWADFYKDTLSYQKEGKNKHDDNADTLSGIWETIDRGQVTILDRNQFGF